jgi:predicted PurR-regulated permease PerM
MRGQPTVSATLMTLVLGAVFVLPVLWLIDLLRAELPLAYHWLSEYFSVWPPQLPDAVTRLPWLGPELQDAIRNLPQDSAGLRAQLLEWARPWVDEVAFILGDLGRNLVKFGFALLTVFFVYRDGDRLLEQFRRIVDRFLGDSGQSYLKAMADTSRAVLYGLVLSSLAQGLLAGLGYWVAEVPAPVLFGALTAVIALIPFGTPLVWGGISVWLLLNQQLWAGIGLIIWGTLVVSWVDNIIRPMVISGATKIPFLLVMFGVLGGLAAFGLIGLFIGPSVIAVLLAVWYEWLDEQRSTDTPVTSA